MCDVEVYTISVNLRSRIFLVFLRGDWKHCGEKWKIGYSVNVPPADGAREKQTKYCLCGLLCFVSAWRQIRGTTNTWEEKTWSRERRKIGKQIKMNYGTKKRSCFLGFQSLSRECNCVEIFFIWQDIHFRFGPREYIYINKNWSLFGTPVEYDCGYFCVSQDMCALDWAPEQWELCGEKPVVESQHEKPLDSAASKLHLARLNHKYKKKTKWESESYIWLN